MFCIGCKDAMHNPDTPSVNPSCHACTVREIARGPHFDKSRRGNVMTSGYRAQLIAHFGSSVEAVKVGNAEVKALWPSIEKARADRV